MDESPTLTRESLIELARPTLYPPGAHHEWQVSGRVNGQPPRVVSTWSTEEDARRFLGLHIVRAQLTEAVLHHRTVTVSPWDEVPL